MIPAGGEPYLNFRFRRSQVCRSTKHRRPFRPHLHRTIRRIHPKWTTDAYRPRRFNAHGGRFA